MPIYMDRHDVSKEVTAESVARLHLEDQKVQHKYNCCGLTYWFDDKRKTAFCLVEAPDAESVNKMHKHAHGELSHSIIEVDPNLVESFLGRMEDPDVESGAELNVIGESAFRFLLSVRIQIGRLNNKLDKGLASSISDYRHKIIEEVKAMQGTVVRQDNCNLLISLTTVQQAVQCGVALHEKFGKIYPQFSMSLGLDAGLPVEGNKAIFEDTIQTSRRLCEMGRGFSVSPMVLEMYQNELSDTDLTSMQINKISAVEMLFFNKLFGFLETNFSHSELSIDAFASSLGYSRSQAYRNSVGLLSLSPNAYLNKYRLEKSLDKLNSGINTVSETGFLCGFSSASYFSKCFRKMYGISPKEYMTDFHS
jgi:AraC-like DNA-binding protein